MKKILILLAGWLFLLNAAVVVGQVSIPWAGDTATEFAGGTGTEQDPYLITTGAHLAKMAVYVSSANNQTYEGLYFRLENDIDLGGNLPEPSYWISIGHNAGRCFKGVFDGNGKKILNMNMRYESRETSTYRGFFGSIGAGGVVKDLTIASGSVYAMQGVGGIAGKNSGTIANCRNYADVTAWSPSGVFSKAGGIVGESDGKVTACVNYGSVTGFSYVGGLIGTLSKNSISIGILENSLNFGTVRLIEDAGSSTLGGLVGEVDNAQTYAPSIENCANFGTIDMNGFGGAVGETGCLVGDIDAEYLDMRNCFNAGSVYIANQEINGIANITGRGTSETCVIENVYNDLQMSGQASAIQKEGFTEAGACLKTADMTKAGGLPGFDAAVWDFAAGAYPMLKIFADDAAKVRSLPPALGYTDAETYDVFNAVRGNFTLPAAYGATWTVEQGTAVRLDGTTATVTRPVDKSDTVILKATVGTESFGRMIVVLMGAVPLTIETVDNGTVKVYNGETALASGTLVEENTRLRLEAEPAEGYILDYFTVNGERWEEPLFVLKGETTVSALFREDKDPGPWDGNTVAMAFGGGLGTATAPYQIRTPEELAYLAQQVNAGTNYSGKYFIVMHNLDLGKHEWTPIGYQGNDAEGSDPSEKSRAFSGDLDGRGKAVRNLSITQCENAYVGLFGLAEQLNTIRNLSVENGYIKVDNAEAYVGMLIGNSRAEVENCHASGRIEGKAAYVGGLLGDAGVRTSGCTSRVNIITTALQVGGIAAGMMVGDMSYCGNLADSVVNLSSDAMSMAGGIVARSSSSDIEYCYNTALVKAENYAGGIAGSNTTSMVSTTAGVSNSYNTGVIEAAYAGGIVGQCSGSVYRSFNVGRIAGVSRAGGIVPAFSAARQTVSTCYNLGEVSVSDENGSVGEIIGYYESGTLRNLYVDKQLNPKARIIGTQAANEDWRLLTGNFTMGLPAGFDTADWVWVKGRYPHLKNVPSHESLDFATAALTLHATNDSVYDVLDDVRFDAGIYTGVDGLTWTVNKGTGIAVNGSVLEVQGKQTVDTCELTVALGDRSKTYRLLVQPLRFRLIVSQTEGGTIIAETEDGEPVTPETQFAPNSTVILSYEAAEGYEFVEWFDGSKEETLTLTMDGDKTVSATFAKEKFTITASAGEGGSITPSDETEVVYGGSQTYTIMADDGYELDSLIVDGKAETPASTYTFSSVKADHTIRVTFKAIMFKISASCGENGMIAPVGDTLLPYGGEITYTITPDANYAIDKLTVDGLDIEAAGTHTFSRIVAEHTIHATFKEKVSVEDVLARNLDIHAKDGNIAIANRMPETVDVQVYNASGILAGTKRIPAGATVYIPVHTGMYAVRALCGNTASVRKVMSL